MKSRNVSRGLFVFLFVFSVALAFGQEKGPDAAGKHLGTWKLVSTKYGDATEFTKYPERSSRLKLINSTHFTWLEVDGATKRVLASAGGKYTVVGNVYTERIEFAGEGMETYLGKAQKFNQSGRGQADAIR